MEYPLNCYAGVCRDDSNELLDLAEQEKWEELVAIIDTLGYLVNKSRNVRGPEEKKTGEEKVFSCQSLRYLGAQSILRNGVSTTELPKSLASYVDSLQPSLWTVLHHAAASSSADSRVLQTIIQAGAFRSLKTKSGETAYDIAASRMRGEEVLDVLKVPDAVTADREVIDRMEASLHKIIRMRSQFLIDRHGLQLPQIAILWEDKDGRSLLSSEILALWFPVPGMYGGFRLEFEEENLVCTSWVRVCGGSEMRHVIQRDGTVLDESEKVAGTFT